MKNDRKEDVFVARRLGRTYDVSGRSSMTSFMDGSTVLVCWDFSHWYEWSLCIVFGAMKWWMVAVGDEILAHVFKFVECRKGRCGRVVKHEFVSASALVKPPRLTKTSCRFMIGRCVPLLFLILNKNTLRSSKMVVTWVEGYDQILTKIATTRKSTRMSVFRVERVACLRCTCCG